ncbi:MULTISPECIES: response regulator [Microbulbifer]|uniref:response regulator n=1 Tax=Microbulbifer TaxID=48073 RepID=UPI001E572CDF|nr:MULTISPECIES: response regulator [Microbulbifer]UHQ54353.1 response regulator [Microbulbifer sp. YPW16]
MINTMDRAGIPVRAALAVLAFAGAAPASAAPLPELFTDTQVALVWPVLLATALVATAVAALFIRQRAGHAAMQSSATIERLKSDNTKLYRRLQATNNEVARRDVQLSETRDTVELLRQERNDVHATINHRLQRPLEAVQGTLNLLLRGGDPESAGLAEMAQRQLEAALQALSQLRRRGGADIPVAEPGTQPARSSGSLSVLLVENEEQDTLLGALEQRGHRVVRMTNGLDGAEAAGRDKFDLVLLDCDLGQLDCVEVTRKIRRHSGRDLPIFALVNALLGGEKERYQAEGLTGVLARPVMDTQLQQLLNWVSRRARQQPRRPAKADTSRLLNPATLERQRDTLGHLAFAELLSSRIAALPKRITSLTSALTGRHWLDAEQQARSAAASSEEVGLEAIASRLRTLADSLGTDSEREYCRHQRTEVLNMMRSSIQQLKAWRDRNVHTAWALK